MAYGMRRYGMRRSRLGLHGQRAHTFRSLRMKRKAKVARIASRRAYRRMLRKPKRVVVKAYANTVGQIAFKRGRLRPSHRRY